MKFVCLHPTEDRRLTKGQLYHGTIVELPKLGTRILVYDDLKSWMTFHPSVFAPWTTELDVKLVMDNLTRQAALESLAKKLDLMLTMTDGRDITVSRALVFELKHIASETLKKILENKT